MSNVSQMAVSNHESHKNEYSKKTKLKCNENFFHLNIDRKIRIVLFFQLFFFCFVFCIFVFLVFKTTTTI